MNCLKNEEDKKNAELFAPHRLKWGTTKPNPVKKPLTKGGTICFELKQLITWGHFEVPVSLFSLRGSIHPRSFPRPIEASVLLSLRQNKQPKGLVQKIYFVRKNEISRDN